MAQKKNVVLFLGAGASKPFGIPLTNEIMPKIWKRLNYKTTKERPLFEEVDKNDKVNFKMDALRSFIGKIYPGFRDKNATDFSNITELLSLIDHMMANKNMPDFFNGITLNFYRLLLERAIMSVISESQLKEEKLLEEFCNRIDNNGNSNGTRFCSVISTNYDTCVEDKLFKKYKKKGFQKMLLRIDFGTSWRDPFKHKLYQQPENPLYRILKLHGSTNWLVCHRCGYIYINQWASSLFEIAFSDGISYDNGCHCYYERLSPIIVSPSIQRDVRDVNLLSIWKGALETLRTAQHWVIIGYSMPSEDLAIKSMFIRAFQSRLKEENFNKAVIPLKIDVVQLGEESKGRYQGIFGNRMTFHGGGLKAYLEKKDKLF